MSNINQIAHELGKGNDGIGLSSLSFKDKGLLLSDYLSEICELAEEIDILTGGVSIDVDYLLGVEGSYLIGIKDGSLNPEDTPKPNTLYETSLFPSLEETHGIEVQVIEEDEDVGDFTNSTEDERNDTEDTTNQGT